MKTEKELNADILKITLLIQEKYPELSKFIGEMPVTIPDAAAPEINNKALRDYYESLALHLKNYTKSHEGGAE